MPSLIESKDFAGRLKGLREKAGLSQYALAKRSGLTKQAISRLEIGNREPNWLTIQLLALALDLSTEDLRDPSISLPELEPAQRRGRPPKQTAPAGAVGRSTSRKKTT
jgi:transcriptional regulator with XRE-family HTH domain